jgi:hypothetical protein
VVDNLVCRCGTILGVRHDLLLFFGQPHKPNDEHKVRCGIVGALVCLWTVWIILWTRALSGPSVEGPIAVTQSGRDGSVTRVVEAGTGDAEP